MKTLNLLSVLAVAGLAAFTFNVSAADALLTPRARENQIKRVPVVANQPDLAAQRGFAVSPRAFENRSRVVKGTADSVNVAATCRVIGSPKHLESARNPAACCCQVATASCPMNTSCCAMN